MASTRARSRVGLVLVLVVTVLVGGWWLRSGSEPPPAAPAVVVERPPSVAEPSRGQALPAEPTQPASAHAEVECQLSVVVDQLERIVVDEVDPDTLEVVFRHTPSWSGAWIRFRPRHADGLGWIGSRRHRRKALAWADGTCTDLVELEPLPFRTAAGQVTGQIEVGGVAVIAVCEGKDRGFSGALNDEGTFALELPADQRCELVVRRVFGGRTLISEPFWVPAATHDLEGVVLPGPVPPGVGLGLVPAEGGLLVHDLEVDGPADRAGVEKRDVVISIDGVPAGDLDAAAASDLEGPQVLEIERGGEVLEVLVPASGSVP